MITEYNSYAKEKIEKSPLLCISPLRITQLGSLILMQHWSPKKARFWEFEREALRRTNTKRYWNKLRRKSFRNIEDVFEYVLKYESIPVDNGSLFFSDTNRK